jgi:hypothetical protein
MDEFTMSAFALYPDGRSSDAFAEVSGRSLVGCFEAMAGEVADWLPGALCRGEGARAPRAIELTLEWSGAPAPIPAPAAPPAPSEPARRQSSPPGRTLSCAARRRPGYAVRVELAASTGLRGAPA